VSLAFSDGTWISANDISVADLSRIIGIHYWQDLKGKTLRTCPFFQRSADKKAWCAIHDCKPTVCREFTPWNWQNHEFAGNCPTCREKAA
ncbi:MAG: hypothetical protein LUP99_05650, partial [Methanomicrobiales archaeon]|nr:hypothetical protein [Methanomicrobiales archaeon]